MKAKLLTLTLLACAFWAQAQGTFQFHATLTGSQVVPPNTDPTIGRGDFWLMDGVLHFQVDVPLETFLTLSGAIHGPSPPGSLAPVIFDLGGPGIIPGNTLGAPPAYRFFSPFDGTFGAGPFPLAPDEISQLQAGLWYVEITSFTMPEGQLRGQILPVPEPSAMALLALGLGALTWRCRRRK